MSKCPRSSSQHEEFLNRYQHCLQKLKMQSQDTELINFFSDAINKFGTEPNVPLEIFCPLHPFKRIVTVGTDAPLLGELMCTDCCTEYTRNECLNTIDFNDCFSENALSEVVEKIAQKLRQANALYQDSLFVKLEQKIEDVFVGLMDFLVVKKEELIQKITRDTRSNFYEHISFDELMQTSSNMTSMLNMFRNDPEQQHTNDKHVVYSQNFCQLKSTLDKLCEDSYKWTLVLYMQNIHKLEVFANTFRREVEELAYMGLNKPERFEHRNPTEVRIKNHHKSNINMIETAPNGQFVVTSSFKDCYISKWDIEVGDPEQCIFTQEPEGPEALAVSRNSDLIAAGFASARIKIWQAKSCNIIKICNYTNNPRDMVTLNFINNDQDLLATYNTQNSTEVLRFTVDIYLNYHTKLTFREEASSSAYHPKYPFLAIGTNQSKLMFLDCKKFKIHNWMGSVLANSPIWSLAYSPDGAYLCAACTEYGLVIIDPKRRTIIKRLLEPVHSISFMKSGPGRGPIIVLGMECRDVIVSGFWNLNKEIYRLREVIGFMCYTNIVKSLQKDDILAVGSDRDLKIISTKKGVLPKRNVDRYNEQNRNLYLPDLPEDQSLDSSFSGKLDTEFEYYDYSSQFFVEKN